MFQMKRFIPALICFGFIFLIPLFPREIDFPVSGLLTVSEEPVIVKADWQDSWFFGSSFSYNHALARIAGIFSEISYADITSDPESNVLKTSLESLGVQKQNIDMHYDLDYSIPVYGTHQAAFSIASKEISNGKQKKVLVFIIIRGTPYVASEWISNLNIMESGESQDSVHEGFSKCTEQIYSTLISYLLKHKIDPDNAAFFITGHSRGAAVSNLLGVKLFSEKIADKKNIFVYTFACPNMIQQKEIIDENETGFIWNIINAEDAVPALPPYRGNWYFQKYGHTKTIVNRWSTDKKIYDENYIPRMNFYYNKFLGRDYQPFKSGSFVQSQSARIVTETFRTIQDYYKNIFNIPEIAKNVMKSIFPSNKKEKPKDENWLISFINMLMGNRLENPSQCFTDMHASEMYLAWILALNEKEAFSQTGSYQIVLDGFYECAVFDENENLVAQILDGAIQYEKTNEPIALMQLPGKRSVIGFPADENFTVVINKESLIPSVVSAVLERYDANGGLTDSEEKIFMYPHIGSGLKFSAGDFLMSGGIKTEKIKGKELSAYLDKGCLEQQEKFFIYPEFSFDFDKQLAIGVHVGKPNVYGSFMMLQPVNSFGSVLELSPGVGHQNALFGNLMLDAEFYTRFIYVFKDVKGKGWNFVPSFRFMLSFKPRNYLQFFAAASFDLNITDFNDGPFDPAIKDHWMGYINFGDKARLVPTISFGIKF